MRPSWTSSDGTCAVGHVRYATTGAGQRENAQPMTLKYVKGTLAVVHNGNLVNTEELRTHFEYQGAIFQTTSGYRGHLLCHCSRAA